ncbi:peptide/nickel transport system substrate-binding protein [Amycolatopsis bartoniae]|uniref:ABC transporter substrate-binding protein n=1 Tax=Amycolatopsis bartoniae TaxID=941986 RepID=A0A8H9MAE2_9PSEU|nr:ABC transporter substrate-binding protein [Amycolatopsis bartoniae]MBB2939752.1 peptide/nickel transport system substrate-binding protein [Amycolatopsis bartoniae]TVT08351.1 ABC transporter substrate-binding protein [Amycolatopsis bartoniae]GHF36062.1 ABC transporter substrate-binding protein [Amycolatopsis bartoniae]
MLSRTSRLTAILTAALTAASLTACAGAGRPATTAGGEVNRAATVRFSIANPPVQFDPIASRNEIGDVTYFGALYDGLTGVDQNGGLVPRLAERWAESPDKLSWAFTLRPGARFHDGAPIDSAAVVANLERALAARSANGLLKAKLGPVTGVQATGPATVTFTVSAPYPSLPAALASPVLGMASPAAFATLATAPVGSGPYKFVSQSANRAVYERFDGYWDPGAAKAARLELLSIPDGPARMNALRSGQIDGANAQINLYADTKGFQSDPAYQVLTKPTQSVFTLYLNTTHAPLDNPDVRRALNYAVDRNALSALVGGLCQPAVQPFPTGPGHIDGAEQQYPYDPEKAKQLLAAAGATGLTLDGIFLAAGLSQTLAPAIQAQLAKAGINLRINGVNQNDARGIFRSGKPDLMVHQINGELDPALTLENNFLGLDSPGGASPEITARARQAIAAPIGSPERTAALEQFSRAVIAEPVHVHVCSIPNLFAGTAKLVGLDQMPWSSITLNPDIRTLGLTN